MATPIELLDFHIERTREELSRQVTNVAEEVGLVRHRLTSNMHPATMPRLATLAVEVDTLRAKLGVLVDLRDGLVKQQVTEAA